MVPTSKLPYEITRPDPLVWVSRLVLLESLDPVRPIEGRDIALFRGLNIVWAKENEDADDTSLVAGHGVGKSMFCRLLRYCLAEDSIGNQRLTRRIRETFPHGAVGAHVHVAGVRWTVVRPLGTSHVSYALEGGTVEQLLADRPGRGSFQQFRERLEAVTQPAEPRLAARWEHVLAWCSRDQETRYQHLWEWRASRSESGTTAFKKPKADAMQFLRIVLGLLTAEEVDAHARLAEIEDELKQVSDQIAERRREPTYWVRQRRKELRRRFQIEQAETASFAEDDLFSLPKLVTARQEELRRQVRELNEQIRPLEPQIAILAARRSEVGQLANTQATSSEATQAAADTMARYVEELERLQRFLQENPYTYCEYGNVSLSDCQHVEHHLVQLNTDIRRARAEAAPEIGARDQAAAALRAVADRASQTVQQLDQQLADLHQQRRQLLDDCASREREARELADAWADLLQWNGMLSGETADQELTRLEGQQSALETEQTQLVQQARQSPTRHRPTLERYRAWFNFLVQAVLPGGYSGSVALQDGEVVYDIAHGNLLAGEAVESLTLLLADVSWMLAGVAGVGRHPGLLAHDSPREADLGAKIYRYFLQSLGRLHTRLGGKRAAPFQYIVTTTTPPPPDLLGDEHVRLLLSNEPSGFLFRQDLGARREQTLFDDSGGTTPV